MPRKVDRGRAFLFYPIDYLNDPEVLRMGFAARGAYGGALLWALWLQPEPGVVLDDDELLAQLSMCPLRKWKAIRVRVSRAFDLTSRPGYWVQKRMVAQYAEQRSRFESFSERGKRGNSIRWGSPSDPSAIENGSPPDRGSGSGGGSGEEEKHVPPAEPSVARQDPATRNGHGQGETTVDSFFERHFWAKYPRKRHRSDALRQWRSLVGEGSDGDDRLANAICDGLEGLVAGEWRDQDARYIPFAHRWLKQRGWET